MFARVPFTSPFEQYFGGYPVHPFQQTPFGIPPHLAGHMSAAFNPFAQMGAFQNLPWQAPQSIGIGPISPLVPQQQQYLPAMLNAQTAGIPFGGKIGGMQDPSAQLLGGYGQYGQNPFEQLATISSQSPFGFGQGYGSQSQFGQGYGSQPQLGIPGLESLGLGAINQQTWQQNDPRAELLAQSIAQITAIRDPRVEYLSKVVTHPAVAANPVLKDLVAKELLTTALQQVTFKSVARPDLQGQVLSRIGEQLGINQNPAFTSSFGTAV